MSPQHVARALEADRLSRQALVSRLFLIVQTEVDHGLLRSDRVESRSHRQDAREFGHDVRRAGAWRGGARVEEVIAATEMTRDGIYAWRSRFRKLWRKLADEGKRW